MKTTTPLALGLCLGLLAACGDGSPARIQAAAPSGLPFAVTELALTTTSEPPDIFSPPPAVLRLQVLLNQDGTGTLVGDSGFSVPRTTSAIEWTELQPLSTRGITTESPRRLAITTEVIELDEFTTMYLDDFTLDLNRSAENRALDSGAAQLSGSWEQQSGDLVGFLQFTATGEATPDQTAPTVSLHTTAEPRDLWVPYEPLELRVDEPVDAEELIAGLSFSLFSLTDGSMLEPPAFTITPGTGRHTNFMLRQASFVPTDARLSLVIAELFDSSGNRARWNNAPITTISLSGDLADNPGFENELETGWTALGGAELFATETFGVPPSEGIRHARLDTESGFGSGFSRIVTRTVIPEGTQTLRFTAAALSDGFGFGFGQAVVELGYIDAASIHAVPIYDAAGLSGTGDTCEFTFEGNCTTHQEVAYDASWLAGRSVFVSVSVGHGTFAPPLPAGLLVDDFRFE